MFPKTDSGSLFPLFAKNPWEALKDQWTLHLQNLHADLRRLDFRIPFHLLAYENVYCFLCVILRDKSSMLISEQVF